MGYEDLFQGLGSFPGVHKIQLKPDATPIIHPPRKIPVAPREKLERELQRVAELGVITKFKVSEPTDWVNSLANPEKHGTGALRVCLDPKQSSVNTTHCQPWMI